MKRRFLGSVHLQDSWMKIGLGQAVTDPLILAKVDVAEAFGNAVKAVSNVVQVPAESMAASPETARLTFVELMKKSPAFISYVLKLLVLGAVVVKERLSALGFTSDQLRNVLLGSDLAVKEILTGQDIKAKIEATKEDIISRAPESIKPQIRSMIEDAGVTADNLAPQLPAGTGSTAAASGASAEGLSGWEMAALIGVPILVLGAIAFAVSD